MKKFFIGTLLVIPLSFTSCDEKNNDGNIREVVHSTYNLISPVGGGDAFAVKSDYKLSFDDYNAKVGTQTTLILGSQISNVSIGATEYHFRTDPGIGDHTTFSNKKGEVKGGINSTVSDFTCKISFYRVGYTNNVPDLPPTSSYSQLFLAQYTIDNFCDVATFSNDVTYNGPSVAGDYTTDKTCYRALLNVEFNKADMVIVNAQFNDQNRLPVLKITNLDIKWLPGGYTVTGKNVKVQTSSGASFSTSDNLVINDFEMKTTDKKLTEVEINYTITDSSTGKTTTVKSSACSLLPQGR